MSSRGPAIWGRFRQSPATGSRLQPIQRKTAAPPFFSAFPTAKPCLRRKASHDLPIMSMPLSPPAQPAISGACPSGHPCWRRHPDRCALNWFITGEPSPSAGHSPFYGNTAFSFIFFSALQRNISTSAFFPRTGLTQGPRWTSSRVSVTKSYNDLNHICSVKHISAFLRRSHRFRPIPGGSP